MTDLREPLELSVQTTASAEELWSMWRQACELAEKTGEHMTDTARRWKNATGVADRQRLEADYQAQAREYRVLASWRDVAYAAFIFATDGAECAAFSVSSVS